LGGRSCSLLLSNGEFGWLHRNPQWRRRTRPRRVWMASPRHRSATRNEHDRVGKEEVNPVRAKRAWVHQRRLHWVPKLPCAARRTPGEGRQGDGRGDFLCDTQRKIRRLLKTAAGAPVEAAAAEGSASAIKEPAAELETAEWDALVAAAATTRTSRQECASLFLTMCCLAPSSSSRPRCVRACAWCS